MSGGWYDIIPFYDYMDENISFSTIKTNENNSDDKQKTITTTTMTRYPFSSFVRSFISISSTVDSQNDNH